MQPRLNCRILQRSPSAQQLDEGVCRRPLFGDDTWVGTRRALLPASRSSIQPEVWTQRPALPFMLAQQHMDNDRLLKVLQEGLHFADDVAEGLLRTTGIRLTHSGLLAMYRQAAPGLRWYLEDAQCLVPEGPVTFALRATDLQGRPTLQCRKVLAAHADLAIEIHTFGLRLLPEMRALIGRCEAQEERMLRGLSKHPRTRLSLAAGAMVDLQHPVCRSYWGTYGHALRGYQFADEGGPVAMFVDYPARLDGDDGRLTDRSLLMYTFADWLRRLQRWQRLRLRGGAAAGAVTLERLLARLATCRTPLDFATFGEAGVHVLGQTAPLGEAFLTSGAAPWWHGVRYVNAPGVMRDGFERALLSGSLGTAS